MVTKGSFFFCHFQQRKCHPLPNWALLKSLTREKKKLDQPDNNFTYPAGGALIQIKTNTPLQSLIVFFVKCYLHCTDTSRMFISQFNTCVYGIPILVHGLDCLLDYMQLEGLLEFGAHVYLPSSVSLFFLHLLFLLIICHLITIWQSLKLNTRVFLLHKIQPKQ